MSKILMKAIAGGALVWVSIGFCAGAQVDTEKSAPLVREPGSEPFSGAKRRSRVDADARECLRFLTNREVARCAEKYR